MANKGSKKDQEKQEQPQVENDGVAQGVEQNEAEEALENLKKAFKDADDNTLTDDQARAAANVEGEQYLGLLNGLQTRGELETAPNGAYRYVGK